MTREEFWRILEAANSCGKDDAEQKQQAIVQQLKGYEPAEIVAFEIILRELIAEAYDYKIVAAYKIINRYVTDDQFLYFRCWLIGQGEKIFVETLENPELLAEVVGYKTDTDFEFLLYAATEAYSQRTGIEEEDESFPRGVAYSNPHLNYDTCILSMKGEDWTIEQLPALCPKLWNKFRQPE